jgi:hypothetical protein
MTSSAGNGKAFRYVRLANRFSRLVVGSANKYAGSGSQLQGLWSDVFTGFLRLTEDCIDENFEVVMTMSVDQLATSVGDTSASSTCER